MDGRLLGRSFFAVPIGIGFTSNGIGRAQQTEPRVEIESDDIRAADLAGSVVTSAAIAR